MLHVKPLAGKAILLLCCNLANAYGSRELKHAMFLSVQFSYFTCLHTTTFTFLSLFALVQMMSLKIWERPMS